MKYLDKLSTFNATGLSMLLGGAINLLNNPTSKISYVVAGTGIGLMASTITGMYQENDEFEELRNEFERRERLVQRLYKKK